MSSQPASTMSRAVRSLETVKNMQRYLPSFFSPPEQKPGELLSWCMAGFPTELFDAFDLATKYPENYGTLCASKLVSIRYCDIAEGEGYPNELCAYLRSGLGYCKRCLEENGTPPEAPAGGLGNPSMMLGSGYTCDPRYKWFQAIATRYFPGIPVHISDWLSPSHGVDVDDERIASHYLEQIRNVIKDLIAFLEKQTGRKLDIDKLRTLLANTNRAINPWCEALQLRKTIPCPMGAEDRFSAIVPQMYMLGSEEAVNFYQALYKEVKHRVDHGIGVLPRERELYRLIWVGVPPWFNLGLFNYFESLGAIFVAEAIYYVAPVELDLSDPVEALAQRAWKKGRELHQFGSEAAFDVCSLGMTGSLRGLGLIRQWIRDFKVDGVVMHRARSCRAGSFGEQHIKNQLEKDGIPSLIFESDIGDPRSWSDYQIKTRIQAFIETLANLKERV